MSHGALPEPHCCFPVWLPWALGRNFLFLLHLFQEAIHNYTMRFPGSVRGLPTFPDNSLCFPPQKFLHPSNCLWFDLCEPEFLYFLQGNNILFPQTDCLLNVPNLPVQSLCLIRLLYVQPTLLHSLLSQVFLFFLR